MGCLRARHVQGSVQLKLTNLALYTVCSQGKSKPGFIWLVPRYSIAGVDVGRGTWDQWFKWSAVADGPLYYLPVGGDGSKLTEPDLMETVRWLLERSGVINPHLFVTR